MPENSGKRKRRWRTAEPTLLQGMLVCRQCGYALYRTSTRTTKRTLYYYRCIGSDGYRHLHGAVCDQRPVRQDHLDEVVWREILRLLEDPALIRSEIKRRVRAACRSDPTTRRKKALGKDITRLQKTMSRLLDAYQEGLLSLDELRRRMPAARKREQALASQLRELESAAGDGETALRLVETLEDFLARLRHGATEPEVPERQRLLRLLAKEIVVDHDTLSIRHSIRCPDPAQPQVRMQTRPRYGLYVTFQLAEVTMPRNLFQKILSFIDDLRLRPAPA